MRKICLQPVDHRENNKNRKASRHKLLFTERIIEEYRVLIVLSYINQCGLLYEFCMKTEFNLFE